MTHDNHSLEFPGTYANLHFHQTFVALQINPLTTFWRQLWAKSDTENYNNLESTLEEKLREK